jgi:hypothetical protein
MISRGQMSFQISTPPEGRNNGKKVKNKKRRVLPQSKKPIQEKWEPPTGETLLKKPLLVV